MKLLLRPLAPTDTDAVLALGNDEAIADMMISVPHPLPRNVVEAWVAPPDGEHRYFAAVRRSDDTLVGVVSLRHIDREHLQAELSFWIGRPFWGQGYASEAATAVIETAFRELGLNRLEAFHMVLNDASAHVLERIGFRREGILRERVRKRGRFEDVVACALLRSEYR